MKISLKYVAIAAFVALLVISAFAISAKAETFEPYIDLGQTYIHSKLTTGGIGLRVVDKWDFQIRSIGQGETDLGYQDQEFNYAVSRLFAPPTWQLLGGQVATGIGVVYSPDLLLVGDVNYRLRLILSYRVVELEIMHDSSASTFDPNHGVDAVVGRIFL